MKRIGIMVKIVEFMMKEVEIGIKSFDIGVSFFLWGGVNRDEENTEGKVEGQLFCEGMG